VLLEDSTLRKFGVYFFLNSATEGERDTKNFIRVPSPSTASVKVKSASLGIRFLITRHSPTNILQTGLLGTPAEKPDGNQAAEEVSVRSLRSGFRSKYRGIRACLARFAIK